MGTCQGNDGTENRAICAASLRPVAVEQPGTVRELAARCQAGVSLRPLSRPTAGAFASSEDLARVMLRCPVQWIMAQAQSPGHMLTACPSSVAAPRRPLACRGAPGPKLVPCRRPP